MVVNPVHAPGTHTSSGARAACGTMNRELALGMWATCLRTNAWPGYPVGMLRIECPPWHESMMTDWKDAAVESGDRERYDLGG